MKQDPLALAFFGAALALLAALLLYVFVLRKHEPAPPAPAGAPGTLESLRSRVEGAIDQLREKHAPAPAPEPAPPPARVAKPAPSAAKAVPPTAKAAPAPAKPGALPTLQPGHAWRYAVTVEPPVWRDVVLLYRTRQDAAGLAVDTEFTHAAGRMNFNLGIYAAGHASHANTRFPGFFMHPSYFSGPLEPGQKLSWGWAWQPQREGRLKRYEAQVLRWEEVTVPAGRFRAAPIAADLYCIEGGQVRAQAKETLWYAPEVAQLVKVVRDGRTPDEGSTRIVAELAEYR
ncbi:MAG: hypothetical protein WAO95_16335 [Burkholderiales bacterium]